MCGWKYKMSLNEKKKKKAENHCARWGQGTFRYPVYTSHSIRHLDRGHKSPVVIVLVLPGHVFICYLIFVLRLSYVPVGCQANQSIHELTNQPVWLSAHPLVFNMSRITLTLLRDCGMCVWVHLDYQSINQSVSLSTYSSIHLYVCLFTHLPTYLQ